MAIEGGLCSLQPPSWLTSEAGGLITWDLGHDEALTSLVRTQGTEQVLPAY